MKTRLVSSVLYAALVLSAVALGGWFYVGIIGFLGLRCAFEYARMLRYKGHTDHMLSIMLGTAFVAAGIGVFDYMHSYPYLAFLLLPLLLLREFWQEGGNLLSALLSWAGMLYLGFGFGALLSMGDFGLYTCFLAFLICWSTDCGAFFIGTTIGKRKLCPRISPNKSVEGAVGGILLCLAVCLTYNHFLLELGFWQVVLIALFCSLMGQLGDLCESAIKRYAGVKDSGHIMPGHGGIFDRMDSMTMAAPALLFILSIF